MTETEKLLQDTWETYKAAKDSLRVADNVLRKDAWEYMERTDFHLRPQSDVKTKLKDATGQLNRLTVLSLWVIFERFILDYLRSKGKVFESLEPANLAVPFRRKFESSVEYWQLSQILNLFKPLVGGALVGDVKNILKYRNFIAHKNPHKKRPTAWDPEKTYQRLKEFVQHL